MAEARSFKSEENEIDFQLSQGVSETFFLSNSSKALKVKQLAQDLKVDEIKVLRKIDIYVLLPFCLLYFVANLGRSNAGLLWITGLASSLKIDQLQFLVSIVTFYVPYVILQSFSNLILKSIRPHFWISIAVLLYGVITIGSAFSKTYGQFLACQALHGIFESGCDSAVIYIFSNYYERSESQPRISFLYSWNLIAVIVNYFCLFGLYKHQESLEHPLWRYILIIDGAITAGASFVLFFILPDFPEGIRFFKDNESLFIIKKLEIFTGKSGYSTKFSYRDVVRNIKDPLIWLPVGVATLWGIISINCNYIQVIGFHALYSPDVAISKAAYPWILGVGCVNITGYLSYKLNHRGVFVIFMSIVAIIGTGILKYHLNHDATGSNYRYSGNFLLISGLNSAYALFLGWTTFNVSGHLRKSLITSLMTCSFDLAGVYGSFVVYKNDIYLTQALLVAFIFVILGFTFSSSYTLLVHHENKKKRLPSYKEEFDMLSQDQRILAGDRAPEFDYLY